MGLVSLTDQLLVGQLGDKAIGAAGIAGQLTALVGFVLTGLVVGVSAITAQFWSRGDRPAARGTYRFSTGLSLLIALPVAGVGIIAPAVLMRPFSDDAALMAVGTAFIRLIAASFLPTVGVVAASGLLRSIGKMKTPLYASVLAVLLNLVLDWTLMFGHFGAPRLGLLGSGVGTLAARLVEGAILLVAARRAVGRRVPDQGLAPATRRAILATAAPLVLNELVWVLSENTYAAVYGHIGTSLLVAMAMTYPLQNLVMGLFTGISAAATPLIGGRLGLGDRAGAQTAARRLLGVTLAAALALVGLVAALANLYAGLYDVSAEVRASAVACLMVFAGFLVVKACNKVIYDGVLATGGDTRYFFVSGTLATWLIGVPLALAAAFWLHYPIWLVYLCLSCEEVVRLVIGWRRVRSQKWMRVNVADIAHRTKRFIHGRDQIPDQVWDDEGQRHCGLDPRSRRE
jgi:putative MATE family efflux protein